MSEPGARKPAPGLLARDRAAAGHPLPAAPDLPASTSGLAPPRRPLSIKLCGVRSVRDARLCAEAGADELGVVFAPTSKRCVSIEAAREIRESLPPALRLIGVFQDATWAGLEAALQGVTLSALQLHGKLPDGLLSPASRLRTPLPIHLALQMSGPDSLAQLDGLDAALGVARVLLDGPRGGSGAAFPWPLVHQARTRFAGPLHLAGGLTPENVAEAINAAAPDGVDVSSGIEGSDGFKDAGKVRAFVQAARAAAAALLAAARP